MERIWQDIRYAFRTFVKAPAFTLVALISLGLGIGANSTIFTLINAVFLNPLPVAQPSELVAVFTTDERNKDVPFAALLQVSYPNFTDYRDRNAVFTGMGVYSFGSPLALSTGGGGPEQVVSELVSANYFDLLGVRPAAGRFFIAEEDRTPGSHPVAVLSYGFWQRRFGGDPALVGREITLNGTPFVVIGVAQEGFRGVNALFGPDVWVPTMMYERVMQAQFRDWFDSRRALVFNTFGRLKPGVSIEQADANVASIAGALEEEFPEPNKQRGGTVRLLTEATVFPGIRQMLVLGGMILMGIVGLVLLIACTNVANLLLARAAARRQEISVRVALGANSRRIVRQLLTESVLLGLMGGLVGLGFAYLARNFIWSMRPPFVAQNFVEFAIDWRVLTFTLAVSLFTGMLFGLVPAIQTARADVVSALKEESRTAGRSKGRRFLANGLVIGQVSLSIVALVAAGLFVRSLQAANEIDPGFETERLALVTVNPGQAGYDMARAEQFFEQVSERLASAPGVRAASWVDNAPLFGGFMRTVWLEGQDQNDPRGGVFVIATKITPGYFDTTGIRFIQGRDIEERDRPGTPPVAVINETMAQRSWPNQDPIGKRFRFYGDTGFREVVGVVATTKYNTIGEPPTPAIYFPFAQEPSDAMNLVIRTAGDPSSALGTAQGEIRSIDPMVPVTNPFTMRQLIDLSLWAPKMGAILLGALGALALTLAMVGLYGVMAYSVTQRQHEIGLRMALGAAQGDVLRLVLRQGLVLVAMGLVIGLVLALAVARTTASLLYGSALDPVTFIGVAAILSFVALIASAVPALRASRVDPLIALRA